MCVAREGQEQAYLDSPSGDKPLMLLKFEDCYGRASGKVGWTDRATHSIETGINQPVKQPPPRSSIEEKERNERELSALLLKGWDTSQ